MIPEIVQRAMTETVTDIGQLSKSEIYLLNKHVKKGYLSKGKGGPFPKLKTIYAHPQFDFNADRERQVAAMMALYELEKSLGLGPYYRRNESGPNGKGKKR